MRTLAFLVVAALAVVGAGCGTAPSLPAWLGGVPSCRLDGSVVEDGHLQPAIPTSRVGGVMNGPLGHFMPKDGTQLTLRLRVDETGHVTSVCAVGEAVDVDFSRSLERHFNRTCDSDELPCEPAPVPAPFSAARLDGRAVPSVVSATYRWQYRVPADAWRWPRVINEILSSTNEARLESIAL
jgi:hypothetical protein